MTDVEFPDELVTADELGSTYQSIASDAGASEDSVTFDKINMFLYGENGKKTSAASKEAFWSPFEIIATDGTLLCRIRNARLIVIDNGFAAFSWEKYNIWGYPPARFFYVTLERSGTILDSIRDFGSPMSIGCGNYVHESWTGKYNSSVYSVMTSATLRQYGSRWRKC